LEDRLICAKKFKETFHLDVPIFADNMENDAETKFASWPFRYVVCDKLVLKMIGTPDDSHFELIEMFDFIENYK
jgi:hypothetical protein